jgi:hypothetical protein
MFPNELAILYMMNLPKTLQSSGKLILSGSATKAFPLQYFKHRQSFFVSNLNYRFETPDLLVNILAAMFMACSSWKSSLAA